MAQQQVPTGQPTTPSPRGFAAMDPAQQREIASKGGRAAHQKGTAHEFTKEEAARAGRKGGEARAQNLSNQMRQQNMATAQKPVEAPVPPATQSPLKPEENIE